MNHIIHALWIGTKLSFVEQLCIRSFLFHGHEFHLYAYNPLKNVPDGAVVRDANQILPGDKVYRKKNGGYGSFANYFRWVLLEAHGGVWVDMDMICLRPFDFPDVAVFGWESGFRIGTAILGFPPGHFMTTVMRKACEDVNRFQPIDTPRTAIKKVLRRAVFGREASRRYTRFMEPGGPAYFTKFVDYYGLSGDAKPVEWFYPIPYVRWREAFEPNTGVEAMLGEAYAVHLWNNALRREPATYKDSPRLAGTLIGRWAEQYL